MRVPRVGVKQTTWGPQLSEESCGPQVVCLTSEAQASRSQQGGHVGAMPCKGVRKRPSRPSATRQPLAALPEQRAKLPIDVEDFVNTFGGRPPANSVLGKQLDNAGDACKGLVEDFPCLSTPTIKRAKRFMKAARAGQSLTPYVTWSKYMRLRVGIKSSELSRLLTATATASGSPGKRVLRGRVGKRQVNSQYDQHVEKDGPVAFAQCSLNGSGAAVGATDAAISRQQILSRSAAIPMTPQFIVDWLYQALLDTVRVFETIMGTASYDASGVANSTGSGEVLLFWGSHLGSLREQGLISWDYDADLAVFHHSHDFDTIANLAKEQLAKMKYACTQHSTQKFRVAPLEPAAWAPYQELYQEVRERNRGLDRVALCKKTGSLWRQGKRARQPHGSNCIDIEVYKIEPNCMVKLLGTKPIQASLDSIFPTAVGVFGPLQFSIPKTASVLLEEYGKQCLQQRLVKIRRQGSGFEWIKAPECMRRVAFPACALHKAAGYLS